MPQGREAPGSARDWLARARGDLALAESPLPPGAFLEDLCFHAQQAAEKALKAIYRHRGWTFRYVHDLEELLTGLKTQGLLVPPELEDSITLTSFAAEFRYPGLGEQVTREEYEEAVRQAQAVVKWAEKEMQS